MPWYYKKHGEYGRLNVSQVTRRWFKEVRLKKLEMDGMARLKRIEMKEQAKQEREEARARHLLNRIANKKRLESDELRRTEAFERALKARKVVNIRLRRIDKWGRENVERAKRMEASRQAAENQEKERIRLERNRELFERRCMAREENERLDFLEQTRTLPEQVMMRRLGLLEGKKRIEPPPSIYDELEDTGPLGGRNRARADLHVVVIGCVRPEREDDDSSSDDERNGVVKEGEDDAYLGGSGNPLPCVLTVDLEKFPAAMELRCNFAPHGKIGMRLLCNTVSPPPPKTSAFLARGDDLEPAPVLVPNLLHLNLARNNIGRQGARMLGLALARGAFPKLKTLDLRSNMIEDAGLKGILDAVDQKDGDPLRRLRTLCLSQNGIGDSGALALSHALLQTHMPNLYNLDLKMNRIRFRGAHGLLSFLDSTCKHRRFRKLNLSGNFIDRTKLKRFEKITPKGAVL